MIDNGQQFEALVEAAELLVSRKERLALAESCTGGLIAKLATDLAGSSRWFERGVVTYSNHAKSDLLGVPRPVFKEHGAVSQACVAAMASGLLDNSPADWGVAVTGVAGPDGGSPERPVGTVWMAWIKRGNAPVTRCEVFSGDRSAVRAQTAKFAIQKLLELLKAE